jgi:hypothetical protein
MENEFVPYDIALAMEELGWGKENTMYYAYSRATKNLYPHRFEFPKDKGKLIKAPLYQQAFRFFREKCGLWAKAGFVDEFRTKHCFSNVSNITEIRHECNPNMTPEETSSCIKREEDNCLRELIKIVKGEDK